MLQIIIVYYSTGFKIMKKILSSIALMLIILPQAASAATVLTGKFNVDNGYAAYLSTNDAVQGDLFSSANNWNGTYTGTASLIANVDYYLHVYAYDQGGIAGFLGQFTLSNNDYQFANGLQSIVTNTVNWLGNNTGWGSAYNSTLTDLGANGVSPWGTGSTSSIPGSAHWIWAGDANTKDIAYFSTRITANASTGSAVPEPATMALMILGLFAMSAHRRKSVQA
jgi:hypothetical protein